MIPTGIMQSALPILTGVLRDRGVAPRYLVGFASWQIVRKRNIGYIAPIIRIVHHMLLHAQTNRGEERGMHMDWNVRVTKVFPIAFCNTVGRCCTASHAH
eukprot:SAG11_NODE_3883_length_2170_cov_1.552390_3_plen_100_part_00